MGFFFPARAFPPNSHPLFSMNFSYFFIRFLTFPFAYLPYKTLHFWGKILGALAFYLLPHYRKRTLSNLALAKDLHLSPEQLFSIAKKSFHNLAITLLEYPRLAREKNFKKFIVCENPQQAETLYRKGTGIIFFCGHLANWEVLFLDGNLRMRGIAIGKPIYNQKLYQWILSIREKNGGKIIEPKNAIKEGLRNLKKGIFFGIVGDQGMPDSGYQSPFLGRKAWSSPIPALLSYKTNSPIIVATTRREKGKYLIHYSNPLWPNLEESLETEVPRLMNDALSLFEQKVKERPQEWLWQHNRWKQQTPKILYKKFRHESLCVILPLEKEAFEKISLHLPHLRKIYSQEFLFLVVPKIYEKSPLVEAEEVFYYTHPKETLLNDFRFKIVFNFSSFSFVKKHYKKLSAFDVFSFKDLETLASKNTKKSFPQKNLSEILTAALCRPQEELSRKPDAK